MSFVMHIPYWTFILILLVIIVGLIWATIKGFHQFRAEHLLYPVFEGLFLCVLVMIYRTIIEFKLLVSWKSGLMNIIIVGFIIFMITLFILALPKLRFDHFHLVLLKIGGTIILIGICIIIMSLIFPNLFSLFSHR